jgi:glyoxylase-like metal-dependent hydrolase (beta-lactamase superfamily II)
MISQQNLTQVAFLPRIFPVNCYLVEEVDGLTLIDTGLSFCFRGIVEAAARLHKPIRRIVLTHGHLDHVGALDALKHSMPDVPVYISSRDARLLGGDTNLLPDEPAVPIRGSVPTGVKTKADVLLSDGDTIGSLLAISAPGHTPGSMAFLDTRNHFLIAGDAFQTRGGLAVSGKLRPWFPFPALATWCKSEAVESAKKLLALQPTLLAVGHGRMLEHPAAAIKQAIAEATN